MEFRIADTFIDSLARLTGEEQKAVKTAASDLQMNPATPGMRFHKLDRAQDRNSWSVRVGSDVRLIVHKTESSLLLCYVGHHDAAYRWAERRRIERHPTTGAAQLVEVRETVREIEVVRTVERPVAATPTPKRNLFGSIPDQEILGFGVPAEWLEEVRAADEDTLFELVEHLPAEAAEALLEVATGGTPQRRLQSAANADPFAHPDAQRRFRVMTDTDELARALEFPWDRWTIFLYPAQGDLVECRFSGAARVAGSAGTGKTIVALHRAAYLAYSQPTAKLLLTTFSDTLARALALKLDRLRRDNAVRERITVRALDRVGIVTHEAAEGRTSIADALTIREELRRASAAAPTHRFSDRFLETEWHDVVDAWQLDTWKAYRDVARLGRKTRLGEAQRALLWSIFEQVRSALAERNLTTLPGAFARATRSVAAKSERPFDFVVVDEAQDVGVAQLRFLG